MLFKKWCGLLWDIICYKCEEIGARGTQYLQYTIMRRGGILGQGIFTMSSIVFLLHTSLS